MARCSIALFTVLLTVAVAAEAQLASPGYDVVQTEKDFEVRRYEPSVWMSSLEDNISFRQATRSGFLKLFRYIQGANTKSVEIPMTAPVLTSIAPSSGPFCASSFNVRFYVPPQFQASPPQPLPNLRLKLERWDQQCVATRKFGGFAEDDNVGVEASKLASSLSNSAWASLVTSTGESSNFTYAIAQYNSPFEATHRHNEVWMTLSSCLPSSTSA